MKKHQGLKAPEVAEGKISSDFAEAPRPGSIEHALKCILRGDRRWYTADVICFALHPLTRGPAVACPDERARTGEGPPLPTGVIVWATVRGTRRPRSCPIKRPADLGRR